MRFRVFSTALIVIVCVAVLGASVLAGMPAVAQGGDPATPTQAPTPTGNGGQATWEIKSQTFQSQYPKGFDFAIEATSSAGKLETATVVWRHSVAAARKRRFATINADGNAATVNWEKTPGDAVPQWAGVEYWWVLTDTAGNQFETAHEYVEYADNTRPWRRVASDDIIVFLEEGVPDEVGTMTLQAMAEHRDFYSARWANPLGYVPRAIIYSSYDTWAEWAPGAGTVASSGGSSTVVAGQTSDSWGATIQIFQFQWGAETTAYELIVHEVAHLYQYANGGTRGALWFVEGNATFFEMTGREDKLSRVQRMAAAGTLPTLQGEGPSGRGAFALDAYYIGMSFFWWLEETYGVEAHKLLWMMIDQGRPWRDALETVTQMNFIDMETTFRTWLGATNAVAPTPIPEPTFFFPPTPTYEPTPKK